MHLSHLREHFSHKSDLQISDALSLNEPVPGQSKPDQVQDFFQTSNQAQQQGLDLLAAFSDRWHEASTALVFIHRSSLKDEFFLSYLKCGTAYVRIYAEIDSLLNEMNADPNANKLGELKQLKERKKSLQESLEKMHAMAVEFGIDKRFRQDLSKHKIAHKKLQTFAFNSVHPRLLRLEVEKLQKQEHELCKAELDEMFMKFISISAPPSEPKPFNASLVRCNRFLRLKSLPLLQVSPAATELRACWTEIKKNARLITIFKAVEANPALVQHKLIKAEIAKLFPEKFTELTSLTSTFLTLHAIRNQSEKYRLRKRLPIASKELSAQDMGNLTMPLQEKWRIFDEKLRGNEDYREFELYLKIYENFEFASSKKADETNALGLWAENFQNIDRLNEIAQSEVSFKWQMQRIIESIGELLMNIELKQCEKISLEKIKDVYANIAANSASLVLKMQTILQAPLIDMADEVSRPARVASSLKLIARSRNDTQRTASTKQFLQLFSSPIFSEISEGYGLVFKYRQAWQEICEQHKAEIDALLAANPENFALQNILAKEHLGGQIFSPIQMRSGRYALMLKDCRLPEIKEVQCAIDHAKQLAADANRAVF